MDTEAVYQVVREIDQELSLLTKEDFCNKKFIPLLEMRNRIIMKYKPLADINWEIKNKNVIKMLKKANWHVQWKYP